MGLTPGMERMLVRTAAAFVGAGEEGFPAPEACGTGERLGKMVVRLPRDQQRLLRIGCAIVDAIAVIRFGRRFAALDDHRARKLLRGLAKAPLGPLRRLHFVLKMMTQFAYFAGEEAWAAVGYDGPWLGRVDVEVAPAPRIGAEDPA